LVRERDRGREATGRPGRWIGQESAQLLQLFQVRRVERHPVVARKLCDTVVVS